MRQSCPLPLVPSPGMEGSAGSGSGSGGTPRKRSCSWHSSTLQPLGLAGVFPPSALLRTRRRGFCPFSGLSPQCLLHGMAATARDAGGKSRRGVGLPWVPFIVTAPLDVGHVMSSSPVLGFSFEKKNLRDPRGTHGPRNYREEWEPSRAGAGEGDGTQHGGKEGSVFLVSTSFFFP